MIVGFIITVLVLALSLVIISKLPLGVEIDSFGKAVIAGAVIGIFNAIAGLIPGWLTVLPKILTLGLFSLIVNVIIFGLAARLIEGFRLKWGIWSALLGAIALAIINSILSAILSAVLPGFAG